MFNQLLTCLIPDSTLLQIRTLELLYCSEVTRVTLFDTAISSFTADFLTETAPCPLGVNGLTVIPFLVKCISMAVFEKKGDPGWIDIQDSMIAVSRALLTFHNNVFLQEKMLVSISDQEREMVFPNSEICQFTEIIKCEKQSATVMRVVSLLGDMVNQALSGGNDLLKLAKLLNDAHTSSGFDPAKIIKVFGECSFSCSFSFAI